MKKPKISLDSEKIQAFFLNHIEKILLGIVVLLMVMIVVGGLRLPHLSKDMTPEGLVSKSNSTRTYIDEPMRWNEVISKQAARVVDFNLEDKVREVQKPTEPLAYALPNSLSRPDFPKLSPREDPQLYPPEHLLVKAVVGPLASYPDLRAGAEYVDPLYPSKSDEDIAKEKAKARMEAKKKAKAELSGDYGPGGSPDGGMPGPGGRPAKAKRGKAAMSEDGGYAGGSGRGARGARGPGGGMPGGPGYAGMGGDGGVMPGGIYPEATMVGYQVQDATNTIARDVASITLMAVVPFQKQIDEFDKKLATSLDYDPNRDYPSYLYFRVQRADVTNVDPATESDKLPWQSLGAPESKIIAELLGSEPAPGRYEPGLYAGVPVEVVDPTYLSEVLTLPAPPYLQRDLWDLLTHPDVPLYTGANYGDTALAAAGTPAAAAGGDDDVPTAPVMRPGGMGGPLGSSDSGGYGGPRGGMGMGGGMRGGMGGGMRGAMGGGMRGGGSATEGMPGGAGGYGGGMRGGYSPMRPGGGYGGMRGGEDSGGYGSGYGMTQTYTPPKYQLVRFVDTHVERGHKYRYRIRVYLHDPNHPDISMFMAPSAASLSDNVRKRVKEQDEADAAKGKDPQTGLPRRTFLVVTPWSEPSPIAELPTAERVFAVKVSPERRQNIKNVPVPAAEPQAEAIALVFDHSKIADIPAHQDRVTRGSVLNFSLDKTKVIHPVTKEVIELEKYAVVTDAMVADLMGGESMRPVSTQVTSTPLTALGEMLVVDSRGNLRVRNEGDDIENIRRFSVPKEDPAAAKAATAGDTPGAMPGDAAPRRGAARRND
jgi:hypothetical protein